MSLSGRRSAVRRFALPLAVLAAAVSAALATSLSAAAPKPFKAVIEPGSATAGMQDQAFAYTITNLTNQELGSANVTIPTDFAGSVVIADGDPGTPGVQTAIASGGKKWTATVSGGVIQLRNSGPASTQRLAQDQWVRVSFTADVPCAYTASDDWSAVVKQANNFNGSGNDFYLDAAVSDLDVTLSTGSGTGPHLELSAPPAAAVAGTAFPLTITAKGGGACNPTLDYDGSVTLSGLGVAPDSTLPGYGGGEGSDLNALGEDITLVDGTGTTVVTAVLALDGTEQIDANGGGMSGATGQFTVLPAALDSFAFGVIGDQIAGTPFAIGATAYDEFLNVKTDYDTSAALSGDVGSLARGCGAGGSSPCPPDYDTDGALAFTDGVANGSTTAFKAQDGRSLTLTDGAVSASSATFNVQSGPLAGFDFAPVADQTAGIAFTVTVTATDAWGNTIDGYSGGASLTGILTSLSSGCGAAGTDPCNPIYGALTFASGVGTGSVVAVGSQTGAVLSATGGAATGSSEPFDVTGTAVYTDCANHPTAPCTGSTGTDATKQKNTVTQVFAPAGGDAGTLTITVLDSFGSCANGSGSTIVVDPPTGHTSAIPVEVTIEYDKSITPGTGVANFVFCVEKDTGEVFDPAPNCKDVPADTFPCISDRRRDNAGDLIIKFLVTDDPHFTKR